MLNLFVSVIIPCYNEEKTVGEAYTRIKRVLVEHHYLHHEILFVNDGSQDGTQTILESLARHDKQVRVIRFSRNFGHQPAVSAGIKHCQGDVAIIIDADMQDPPELFPAMIETYLVEGCNVVYAVRETRAGETPLKRLTAGLFYRVLNKLSETPLPLDTGDFRLIDRKVIEEFNKLKEKNKYIRGLISWFGFKQVPIYYKRERRFAGETKYPFAKMLKFALTGLLYFTKRPLQLAMNLGFFSIVSGLALALYVFISLSSAQITTVPGWASTLIALIFFGGIQLFTVGVLGAYVGMIFDEVKERPEFIIEREINLVCEGQQAVSQRSTVQ